MATRTWLGRAKAVAHILTATPGGTIGTETFTLTINGKSITYTAIGGDTVALVVDGLLAAWQVADDVDTEFAEATVVDSTTLLTITGVVAGNPLTVTGSATGSATLVVATDTAATGPNHWDDLNNWSGGAVPVNSDDVFIDVPVPILYGLDQSAVTLDSLTVSAQFANLATIGLPAVNASGYTEYRDQYLQIGATACTLGVGQGQGSQRIKIDFGAVQTACEVVSTGFAADGVIPAVLLLGSHASNTLDVRAGSVGVAVYGGETATVLTIKAAAAANVQIGEGVTLTNLTGGGIVRCDAAITTATQSGGEWFLGGQVTTIAQTAGQMHYTSAATITTATIAGVLDVSGDPSALTITTCNLNRGGRIVDPQRRVVYTNGIARGADVGLVQAT